MNPDDELNNILNDSKLPDVDPSLLDLNMLGMDDQYPDAMNQYLSDTVSDTFKSNEQPKEPIIDDLNPADPYGLGGADDLNEPIDINDLVGLEGVDGLDEVQPIDQISDTSVLNDINDLAASGSAAPVHNPIDIEKDITNLDGLTSEISPEDSVQMSFGDVTASYDSNSEFVPEVPNYESNYQDVNLNDNYQDVNLDNNYQAPVDDTYEVSVQDVDNAYQDAQSLVDSSYQDVGVQDYGTYDSGVVDLNAQPVQDTGADMGFDPNTVDLNGIPEISDELLGTLDDPNFDMNSQQDYNPNPYGTAGYNPPDVNTQVPPVDYNNSDFTQPDFGNQATTVAPPPPSSEEVLKGPKGKKQKAPKTKKKGGFGKFVLFLFILCLLGGAGYGGYYYYTNYMTQTKAATSKEKFFDSVKNANAVELINNSSIQDLAQKLSEQSYSAKIELSAKSSIDTITEGLKQQGIDLQKLKLIVDYTDDKDLEKSMTNIKIHYGDNDIYTNEEIINKDQTAIRTDGITEKYLVTDGSNIRAKEIFAGKTMNASVPLLSNGNDKVDISESDINKYIATYFNVIVDNLPDSKFTTVDSVKLQGLSEPAEGIKLTLTSEDINNIAIELLEALKADTKLLGKVATEYDEDNTIQNVDSSNVSTPTTLDIDTAVQSGTEPVLEQPVETPATNPDTVVNTYTEADIAAPATTEGTEVTETQGQASELNASLEIEEVPTMLTSTQRRYSGWEEVLTAILTKTKSRYSVDELQDLIDEDIDILQRTPVNESKEYSIVLYTQNNKVQEIRVTTSGTSVSVTFTYGDKQSMKVTVLDNSFDSLESMFTMATDSALGSIDNITESLIGKDKQSTTTEPEIVRATPAETPELEAALVADENTTNTAQMNDQTLSSDILNIELEDDNSVSTSKITIEKIKDPTSGFSFIVEKSGNDVSTKYNYEIDLISNKEINHKVLITLSTNGTSSQKESRNSLSIAYNSKNGEIKLDAVINITFDISKVTIPDFTTDNAYFVDRMSDAEIAELKVKIDKAEEKLQETLRKNLHLIDGNNAPVEVEQPVIINQPTNRITQEEAQNKLVEAISNYMGELINRGEEFTLGKLETFTIPGHEFSAVVNGEIAIIEMDGYRFHLDSSNNLVAE